MGLIDKLTDLEVGVRLSMAALRTIEAWHRIANTLGLERRSKPVPDLSEHLRRLQADAGEASP